MKRRSLKSEDRVASSVANLRTLVTFARKELAAMMSNGTSSLSVDFTTQPSTHSDGAQSVEASQSSDLSLLRRAGILTNEAASSDFFENRNKYPSVKNGEGRD